MFRAQHFFHEPQKTPLSELENRFLQRRYWLDNGQCDPVSENWKMTNSRTFGFNGKITDNSR